MSRSAVQPGLPTRPAAACPRDQQEAIVESTFASAPSPCKLGKKHSEFSNCHGVCGCPLASPDLMKMGAIVASDARHWSVGSVG
jgi:hypothetical protein